MRVKEENARYGIAEQIVSRVIGFSGIHLVTGRETVAKKNLCILSRSSSFNVAEIGWEADLERQRGWGNS